MISLTYLYSKFFKKILRGRCVINSQIHPNSHVDSATEFHNSTMDKYSYVGYDSQVYNAQIGPFCSIGDYFLCGGATHPMDWLSTSSAFYGGVMLAIARNWQSIKFHLQKELLLVLMCGSVPALLW